MVEKSKDKPVKDTSQATTTRQEPVQSQIQWNTQNIKSSYANVCTMNSTREEVILNFGINQAWERGENDIEIELNNRIILSPFAAQRMLDMLAKLMNEYQMRYGELPKDIQIPPGATKQ